MGVAEIAPQSLRAEGIPMEAPVAILEVVGEAGLHLGQAESLSQPIDRDTTGNLKDNLTTRVDIRRLRSSLES